MKNRQNRGAMRALKNELKRKNNIPMPTVTPEFGARCRLSHTVDLAPRAYAFILGVWREHGCLTARVQLERNRAIKMSVPITDIVLL